MGSIVVTGQVVTLDGSESGRKAAKKRVWIRDGLISAVTGPTAEIADFDEAPRVDVGNALVVPGFVDLHNHVGYNSVGLWAEPTRETPWMHNKHWTNAASYQERVTWPASCWATATPEALLAYIQVRALVGGTTCQQGWPTASRKDARALRSVDSDGGTQARPDPIESSVGEQTRDGLARRGQHIAQGVGFIYHCSEGRPDSGVGDQFDVARLAGVLAPTFIGVHCCGVNASQWASWPKSAAGAVAWSPFSNYWLYGLTTNIPAARKQNISVCLGSDWGPSGTKNLLGELKVARLASDHIEHAKTDFELTDDDLLDMVTVNPGKVLGRCWNVSMGQLVPGALGDLTIIRPIGRRSVATQVVHATESQVALVVVDGVARYGETPLMKSAKATNTFALTIGLGPRLVSLPQSWTWKRVLSDLQSVIDDPQGMVKEAQKRRDAHAGPLDSSEAPLVLTLDMPGGTNAAVAGLPPDFSKVEFGEIPSLIHDDTFFTATEAAGFHGGLLNGLRAMF
jgi:5-methylthioadenosine/S-adenosylhomocysteine deaminase